jgi:predicted cation transporter
MYYYIFYRTKLIPRWITVWGIIGITLSGTAAVLGMFGVLDTSMATQALMNAPIFLQEMVMAVWLIVKGFDPAAVDALSTRADRAGVAPNASIIKQRA